MVGAKLLRPGEFFQNNLGVFDTGTCIRVSEFDVAILDSHNRSFGNYNNMNVRISELFRIANDFPLMMNLTHLTP